MSLVTYASTHGTASGYSHPRTGGELIFTDAPANLTMSYTYDAGITGVEHDGTTTFTVLDLTIRVDVPGYFRATPSPGTISWEGGLIHFDAAYSVLFNTPPSVTIDVTFAAGGLTPGALPPSLDGLEGVWGQFSAQAYPSISYRGDGGQVYGTAVAAPEPSSAILMVLGLIGCILAKNMGRIRRLAHQC